MSDKSKTDYETIKDALEKTGVNFLDCPFQGRPEITISEGRVNLLYEFTKTGKFIRTRFIVYGTIV